MIKRVFSFDDEPISGTTFWLRFVVGFMLVALLGLGLWIQAASAFKRAGRFGWRRRYRILSAFLIPVLSISVMIGNAMDPFDEEVHGVLAVQVIASIMCTLFVMVQGQPIQRSHD